MQIAPCACAAHRAPPPPSRSPPRSDVALHQALKYSPEGKQLMALGTRLQPGSGPASFCKPTQVAVGRDGTLYVSGPRLPACRAGMGCVWFGQGSAGAPGAAPQQSLPLPTHHPRLHRRPADGYCNSRVAQFHATGTWVRDFTVPTGKGQPMLVPHRWAGGAGLGGALLPGGAGDCTLPALSAECLVCCTAALTPAPPHRTPVPQRGHPRVPAAADCG